MNQGFANFSLMLCILVTLYVYLKLAGLRADLTISFPLVRSLSYHTSEILVALIKKSHWYNRYVTVFELGKTGLRVTPLPFLLSPATNPSLLSEIRALKSQRGFLVMLESGHQFPALFSTASSSSSWFLAESLINSFFVLISVESQEAPYCIEIPLLYVFIIKLWISSLLYYLTQFSFCSRFVD